jgi:hypothetical protein
MKFKLTVSIGICICILIVMFLLITGGFIIPVEYSGAKGDVFLGKDVVLRQYLDEGARIICYRKRFIGYEDVLEGPFQVVRTNGAVIMQGSYKDGRWNGPLLAWHDNMMLSSIQYFSNGINIGIEMYWDDDGRRLRRTYYSNGEKNGTQTYWITNGSVELVIRWAVGIAKSVEIYSNGTLSTTLIGEPAAQFPVRRAKEAARRGL